MSPCASPEPAAGAGAPLRTVLRPSFPVDLRLSLGPAQRGGGDPSMRIGRGEVWRAVGTPLGPVTMHLTEVREGIEVEAWGPGAPWAMEVAPATVGLLDDPGGFAPQHRVLRELHHRLPGLRIVRTATLLESLVAVVLEQRWTSIESRRAWARLVRGLGEPAPGPPQLRLTVPAAPRRLATTPWWAFHPFGIERRRAEVLGAIALHARHLTTILELPLDAARERLLALPGVGPWTAAQVALIALGDADAVPVGDYHIPDLVSWALAGEARGDDARMLALLEPYAGHRGRVLRLLGAGGIHAPRYGPPMPARDIAAI